jgi:hypothetical protein
MSADGREPSDGRDSGVVVGKGEEDSLTAVN